MGRGFNIVERAQGSHRHGGRLQFLGNLDFHLGVHAGQQQRVGIVQQDQYREHGDALLHHGQRFDLFHQPAELLVGIGRYAYIRLHARVDLADVGLVHPGPHQHPAQVGHTQQQRAAADVLGRRGDDLSRLHVALDNGAVDGRKQLGIVECDPGVFHVHPRPHQLRLGFREGQRRFLELTVGDGVVTDQFLSPLHLQQGDGAARFRGFQGGFGLGQVVGRDALVDSHQQGRLLHPVAVLGANREYFTGGLGLEFHGAQRLDYAGGFHEHADVP